VNTECFTVNPVTPSLPTTAGTSPVPFGSAVTDTAVLRGASKKPGTNGSNATYSTINATNGAFAGTIGFTLKGPDLVTGTECTANATPFPGETQTFPINVNVTGNGTIGPVRSSRACRVSTTGLRPTMGPGTGGTAVNNVLAQTYNGNYTQSAEDVVVQQIPTDLKTKQSWFPNDTATICTGACTTTSGNLAAGGTVDFFLYDNATCNGNVKYSEGQTLNGGAATEEVSTHSYTGSTAKDPSNATVTPFSITTLYTQSMSTSTGPYLWKVVYTRPPAIRHTRVRRARARQATRRRSRPRTRTIRATSQDT
jgi:hypothetical protein